MCVLVGKFLTFICSVQWYFLLNEMHMVTVRSWTRPTSNQSPKLKTVLLTQILKYKEDDFTDSDAVACFQDLWILFRQHVTPALPSPPPSHLYSSWPLSQSRRVELVTARTQGATWLLHVDDTDTQLAAGVLIPEGSQFIMHSRNNIIAQSQHDKLRSLPTNFDKPCCSSSCWSAPPTWSSTTLPWNIHH